MPHGDKTGPEGAGPMTGRKSGYCTGNTRAGWRNPRQGRGGQAKRRNWGFHRFPRDYQTATAPKADISHKALESERDVLRGQLEEIEQQLSALNAKNKE